MEEKEPQTEINNDQENESGEKSSLKEINPKMSPVSAGYIGLILVFLLYQMGGSLLSFAILGLDLRNADVNAVRLLTAGGQILFILLPALIITRSVYFDVTRIIRFHKTTLTEVLLFVVGLFLLIGVLQSYLFIQNFLFEKLAEVSGLAFKVKSFFDQIDKMVEETYTSILMADSIIESFIIIFVVAIVPAVCEEIFFRGFVQRSFEFKYKFVKSALITATFFGIYHFHPYQILPLIALGFYFSFATYKSDSIIIPMVLHFLNNLFAVIVFFIVGKEDIVNNSSASNEEIKYSILFFIGMLVLFISLMFYINKFYNKMESRANAERDVL